MKISVALCTFNGEKYIKPQLNSILGQSMKVDEIIIYDDLSSDDTVESVREIANQFGTHILVHVNEVNIGARKNFELAIQRCTGDIIFLSDQDDLWHLNKVEKVMEVLERRQDIDGVFTNARIIDADSNILKDNLFEINGFSSALSNVANETNLFEIMIVLKNIATGATMAIRKRALKSLLPFQYFDKGHWHDYWIALKLSMENKLLMLNEELIYYRIHSNQQTQVANYGNFAMAKEKVWFKDYSELEMIEDINWFLSTSVMILDAIKENCTLKEEFLHRILLIRSGVVEEEKIVRKIIYSRIPLIKRKLWLFNIWLMNGRRSRIGFRDVLYM